MPRLVPLLAFFGLWSVLALSGLAPPGLAPSGYGAENAPFAVLEALQGSAQGGAPGSLVNVLKGARLLEGQQIRTAASSVAVLSYPDGSRLKLNAETALTVHLSLGEAGAELVAGGVFAHVKPQAGKHFYIRTPAVVMGVRGTEFFTAFGKEAQSEKGQDLWMCVQEGSVAVETDKGAPVVVAAGFGVYIRGGSEVTPPKKFEWTKKLNWNMDPAAGELMDHTSIDSRYHDLLRQHYD